MGARGFDSEAAFWNINENRGLIVPGTMIEVKGGAKAMRKILKKDVHAA